MKIAQLFLAICISIFASSVLAGPAVVVTGETCGVLFPKSGVMDFYTFPSDLGVQASNDSNRVITNNGNGNLTFRCAKKGVPNDTGGAVKFNHENTGMGCGVEIVGGQFYVTDNWQQVLTPSGRAVLVCHVNLLNPTY